MAYAPEKTATEAVRLLDDNLRLLADIRHREWSVPGFGVGLEAEDLDELLARGEYVERRLKAMLPKQGPTPLARSARSVPMPEAWWRQFDASGADGGIMFPSDRAFAEAIDHPADATGLGIRIEVHRGKPETDWRYVHGKFAVRIVATLEGRPVGSRWLQYGDKPGVMKSIRSTKTRKRLDVTVV